MAQKFDRAELEAVFNVFDVDKSGKVSMSELENIFKKLVSEWEKPEKEEELKGFCDVSTYNVLFYFNCHVMDNLRIANIIFYIFKMHFFKHQSLQKYIFLQGVSVTQLCHFLP